MHGVVVGRASGIPTVALRFFNVYGPRQALANPHTGLLANFAARLLEGLAPLVNEDGQRPPVRSEQEPLLAAYQPRSAGTITSNRPFFDFRPVLQRSTNATVTFCDRRGPRAARAVIVSYTGRPRVDTVEPDGRDWDDEADKAALLRRCLHQLSPEHREVIDLVYYHEMSIAEVSGIVGIPENTVKTRMFYARKRISELLKAAGVDRGWP